MKKTLKLKREVVLVIRTGVKAGGEPSADSYVAVKK